MTMEKWLIQPGESRVIDTGIVRALKVALIAGQIDIIGHDEDTVRIEVHDVTGRDLKVSIDGDKLEIDHPQLRWENFLEVFQSFGPNKASAGVSVLVPRDIELSFGVVSAEGLVSGLETSGRLSTVSGELQVDNLTGDIELNAVSGAMSIQGHTGAITAHSVSGDVTASGELSRFGADTVSGDVFVDVTGRCDRVGINSVSGDLTARIDADLGARYSVNTATGRLQLDGQSITGTRGRAYTHTEKGTENFTVEIGANTVSGNVTVLRRQPEHTPFVDSDGTAR